MEMPQYIARPKKVRALVPEALKLLVLGAIFYVGILLNMNLLAVSLSMSLNILIASSISVLIVIQLILTYLSLSKTSYDFYIDRLEITGKKPQSAHYYDLGASSIRRKTFDKLFGTGTIVLGPKMMLNHVEKPENVLSYLQNMIQYNRQN